jgi:hypothetical protein
MPPTVRRQFGTPANELFFEHRAETGDRYLNLFRIRIPASEPFAGTAVKAHDYPSSEDIKNQFEQQYISSEFSRRGLNPSLWRSYLLDITFASRFRFLQSLDLQIPGDKPEITTFLDPVAFRSSLKAMEEGLGYRPFEFPTTSVDSYFAAHSGDPGRVVFIIGHVEGDEFVMRNFRDDVVARHNILTLMDSAKENDILLIPIGCNTADVGVPVGSTRNISTDDVVSVLRSLKEQHSKIGDVFRALEALGEIRVNFNMTSEIIEGIVRDHRTGFPNAQFYFPRVYV